MLVGDVGECRPESGGDTSCACTMDIRPAEAGSAANNAASAAAANSSETGGILGGSGGGMAPVRPRGPSKLRKEGFRKEEEAEEVEFAALRRAGDVELVALQAGGGSVANVAAGVGNGMTARGVGKFGTGRAGIAAVCVTDAAAAASA